MTAFDSAWDAVKRWDDWQEEIVDLRSPEEQLALPVDQMPFEGDEPALEPQIDMGGDACCINAKNQWIEAVSSLGSPSQSYTHIRGDKTEKDGRGRSINHNESIWGQYKEMPCDEFRLVLEQFAGLQPDKNIEHWMKINDAEKKLAQRLIQEWDQCSADAAPDTGVDMWRTDDPFEVGWGHIAKKHPKEDMAWRTLESGESMPGPANVAGTKGKRHYQKLGTDLFGQSGSSVLAEPFAGGLGLTFGIRPPKAFIGNDLSRYLVNMYQVMRDNHRALEWDPREEYTYRVGDPRTFSSLTPGGPTIDLPPVSAQEVKDWHEITGGVGLDEDRMYGSNLRYFELRRRLNDMMADGGWRTSRRKAEEMARLTAILDPQRISGLMRVNNPTDQFLNIGPRGPDESKKKQVSSVLRTHPEAYKVAQDLLDKLKDRAKAGGIPANQWNKLSINTTIPYDPQRFHAKSGVFRYEPWSREMRDNKYHFLQGEANPFLSAIRSKVSPETTMLGVDPPYYGELGEHANFTPEKTASLMDALRPFADEGFPMIAFNSAQMPKKLWDRAGLEGFELWPRNEKQVQGKATQVLEQIGTANIPGVTQERVQEAQSWPASEDPVRGYYRHNVWGGW